MQRNFLGCDVYEDEDLYTMLIDLTRITGKDSREGSTQGYPAHQGAHLRLWVAAYLNARTPRRSSDDSSGIRPITTRRT